MSAVSPGALAGGTTRLRSLDRFASRLRRTREGERCEVCSAPLATAHRHVVDRTSRRLLCACAACAMAIPEGAPGRLCLVPRAVRALPEGAVGPTELQSLGVPVGLAFFLRSSVSGKCAAVFPSPAGATEAEVTAETWAEVASRSEALGAMNDDVEALLVRSERDGRTAALIVPVDVCYELVAMLRRTWRGIDGGPDARRAVDAFFADLAGRAERRGA